MRIAVLSDLHLDHDEQEEPFVLPKLEADVEVLVVAGDVDLGKRGFEWIRKHKPDIPVIYVLGNHEFYHHAIPELTVELRQQANNTGIHLLENEAVTLNGITFLGCTLWTDFKLFGSERQNLSMAAAQRSMNDFNSLIKYRGFAGDDGYSYDFEPHDSIGIHHESVKWLRHEFESRVDLYVVVTHHAPCTRSIQAERRWHRLSPAFASELDDFVARSKALVWIHGHIHHRVDFMQGQTRVVSNPRGYPTSESGFDPHFTVDLG